MNEELTTMGDATVMPTAAPLLPGGMDDSAWLLMARNAHNTSQSYFESSVRKAIIDDIKQAQSIHKSGSKYLSEPYRTRSRLFRPKTRATIRKNEASAAEAFFSTREVIQVTAQNDEDDLNLAAASFMKELMQFRLGSKDMHWFQNVIGAYQEAQTVGVVCSFQDWKFDERKRPKPVDRPDVKLIPVENLRVDPACDWTDPVGTSPYLIHEIPMYVKDIRMKAHPRNGHEAWRPVTTQQIMSASKKNMDTVRQVREGRQDSKDQSSAITDFTIAWVHRNIIEVDGQDYVFHTLGTEVILSSPVLIEQLYFHGMRPYVMGCMAIEAHRTYPGGIPRMTADLQAEINEVANMRQDNIKFAMTKRYHVKRNVQVDLRSLMRNVPGSATLMNDPEHDVKVVDTPDVTASAYKEQDVLNVDFDDMAGTFSQSSVQTNKNLNETVGGFQMLDEKANQVGNYQLRVFAVTWVEPVLLQLLALEAHYESDPEVLARCMKSSDIQKYGVDTITNELMQAELIVQVQVGQGATSPQGRMATLTNAFGTIRANLQDGVLEQRGLKVRAFLDEVCAIAGYKDSERFFSTDTDPALAAAQKQIQDMKAAMDAKYPPELLEAMVKKATAEADRIGKAGLRDAITAAFEAMQAAGIIAVTPAVAPIADAIMKAGGYEAPTPVGVSPQYENGVQDAGGDAVPQLPAPVPGVTDPNAAQGAGEVPNSDPLTRGTGAAGAKAGIETPRNDS